VVDHGCIVFWSKKVRTWLVGILLVIFFGGFVSVGEVNSRNPAVFLVSAFITCPMNNVKQFAGFPVLVIVFGVRNFPEFIFYIIVNHNGFRWWRSPVIKAVRDMGLELRDVENGMHPAEVVGKRDTNRVPTNAVDNFEGTNVSFGKSP